MKKKIIFALVIVMGVISFSGESAAEKEILKHKDNNALWFKHVCNIDMRVNQLLWQEQLDKNPRTLTVAPPRTGKTYAVEMHGLKACAVNPWEDYVIFAPAVHQSSQALKYHIDAIIGSPILQAYIESRIGRRQLGTTGYAFQNGSNAAIYGQTSKLDGVNATILRGEEFDDLDMELWKDRILPRGMAKNRNGLPTRIRITGVIQGKENLYSLETDPNYFSTDKIDIYDAQVLDIIDADYVDILRETLTDDQWLRIALVKYVESRNFFWSTYIRRMQKKGQAYGAEPVIPTPGGIYKSTGKVGCGLDMGGQGESATSSKYSIHFVEKVGIMKRWLYGEEFEPTANPKAIRKRVLALWDFFRPVGGYADAFDSNLVADINDDLYNEGIISYKREREHAENKSENWKHWTLRPMRFHGSAKHSMFKGLQNDIHQEMMITPMVIRGDDKYVVLDKTMRQLENIRSKKGGASYLLYEMIKVSVGDDNVDGLAMANAYLDDGKDTTIVVEGFGSGQKMIGHTAGRGDFLT